MKKIILLFSFFLFLACSEEKEVKKITIAVPKFDTDTKEKILFKEIIEPFEEYSGIEVKLEVWDEEKLFKRASLQKKFNDVTVDMVMLASKDMSKWKENGLIRESSALYSKLDEKEKLINLHKELKKPENYFLTLLINGNILVVNKKTRYHWFKEWDINEITWTKFHWWRNIYTKIAKAPTPIAIGEDKEELLKKIGLGEKDIESFLDTEDEDKYKRKKKYVDRLNYLASEMKEYDDVVKALEEETVWAGIVDNLKAEKLSRKDKYYFLRLPDGLGDTKRIFATYGIGLMEGTRYQDYAKEFLDYITKPEVLVRISDLAEGLASSRDSIALTDDGTPKDVMISLLLSEEKKEIVDKYKEAKKTKEELKTKEIENQEIEA